MIGSVPDYDKILQDELESNSNLQHSDQRLLVLSKIHRFKRGVHLLIVAVSATDKERDRIGLALKSYSNWRVKHRYLPYQPWDKCVAVQLLLPTYTQSKRRSFHITVNLRAIGWHFNLTYIYHFINWDIRHIIICQSSAERLHKLAGTFIRWPHDTTLQILQAWFARL